ncbi:MAG: isochorismatase family protein, partial [Pseudolabrys sp.]
MIKDILVSLPIGRLSDSAVNYAVSVAETFEAHLTGVAFVHEPFVPGTVLDGAATGFIATYRAEVENAAKAAVTKFEDATRRAGVSATSQTLKSTLADLDELFTQVTRRFDLSVVGQIEPGAVAEIAAAREIVPNINRLAGALRRAGGLIVWIVSTYGPGAERDWTTFFNFIMTGETADNFRLAFQKGRPEHGLWRELQRHSDDPVVSKNRLTPFADPSRQLETMLRSRG